MKKIENSFAVTGFIGKDAEIRSFETASVARFSIAVSRADKTGEETSYVSAFMGIEAWRKNEALDSFDVLKKGELITVEGYFKPEEWTDSIQRSIDNNSRGGDLKIANIEVDGENVVFTTDGAYSAFVSQLTEPMTVIVDTTACKIPSAPVCCRIHAFDVGEKCQINVTVIFGCKCSNTASYYAACHNSCKQ